MATPNPSRWRVATVLQVRVEATGVRTYTFAFDEPVVHEAGQHYELRLTAEDGYQAARLYSAASPGNGDKRTLELTIALMPYGEISPYLFRAVKAGSQIELRGPLGRHFVWAPDQTDPVLMIGGGTGIVPLRAIRQAHVGVKSPMLMVYSTRTYHDVVYKYELMPDGRHAADGVIFTFTEQAPADWTGYARRIDAEMIAELLAKLPPNPIAYVCGPTPMVESVADLLVAAGIDAQRVKTERFGPTGT